MESRLYVMMSVGLQLLCIGGKRLQVLVLEGVEISLVKVLFSGTPVLKEQCGGRPTSRVIVHLAALLYHDLQVVIDHLSAAPALCMFLPHTGHCM